MSLKTNVSVLGVLSYFVDSVLRGSRFFFVFFFFFALCEISARNCKLKKKNLLMFKRLSLDKGQKKKKNANVSLLMEGNRIVGAFQIRE